jgi:hypothetical protein
MPRVGSQAATVGTKECRVGTVESWAGEFAPGDREHRPAAEWSASDGEGRRNREVDAVEVSQRRRLRIREAQCR